MDLLNAVNLILPVLGEHPATSLTAKHPTLAVLLPKIDLKLSELLGKGWWFNTYRTKLYPNEVGEVQLPLQTLAFVPDQDGGAIRGTRLFNTTTGDFQWSLPVEGFITDMLEFNDLPESAANLVMYNALVSAYVTDIGMESNVQVWMREAAASSARLETEHLRNKRYSTTRSHRYWAYRHVLRG